MRNIKWYTWIGIGILFFVLTLAFGKIFSKIDEVAHSEAIAVKVESKKIDQSLQMEIETKDSGSLTSMKQIPKTRIESIDVPIRQWTDEMEQTFFNEMEQTEFMLDEDAAAHFSLQTNAEMLTDDLYTIIMQYEQSIAQRLPHVTSWAISDVEQSGGEPALTLRFDDNAQWVLTGTPTAANQYGSAGQTQFLEIAGQTVPCTDAQSSERQCLYARTVQYDASGVKQSYGDWQPLYNSIEGYQHNAGVRNVIRVKQYERQNPSPDASRQAYVFDQVVESETVGKGAPLPR